MNSCIDSLVWMSNAPKGSSINSTLGSEARARAIASLQKVRFEYLLEDSPSLRGLLVELFSEFYVNARKDILKKYELDAKIFPMEPEFSLEDILNADYIPE